MKSNLRTACAIALASVCLTANAQHVSKLLITPISLQGGSSATATIELVSKVGAPGATALISSSSPDVVVPASVSLPTGAKSATFTLSTVAVSSLTTATIKVMLGSSRAEAILKVDPPKVSKLTFSAPSINGGLTQTGTVDLNSPAPTGGIKVTLVTHSAAWNVPASVTVPAGLTSATFSFKPSPVDHTTEAAVMAELSGAKDVGSFAIKPPTISTLNVGGSSILGSTPGKGSVNLASPAPADGFKVALLSSSHVVSVPANVKVAPGETIANFDISTKSVAANTTVTITANATGSSVKESLTVSVASLTGFSLSSSSVNGGTPVTGTVTISAAAPASGYVVSLSSSVNSVQVPSAVTITAGQTSATFPITTSAVTGSVNASITALASNGSTQKANLTVGTAIAGVKQRGKG